MGNYQRTRNRLGLPQNLWMSTQAQTLLRTGPKARPKAPIVVSSRHAPQTEFSGLQRRGVLGTTPSRAIREVVDAAIPLQEAMPRHQQKTNSNSVSLKRTPELFPHLQNRGSLYLIRLWWELSTITFIKSLTLLCR